MSASSPMIRRTRQLAVAMTLAVAADVIWLRIPFLAVVALPFVLVAWRYRDAHRVTNLAVVLCCAGYAAIALSYALNNGLHAPAEVGRASQIINPGDFAFVYIGGPVAVWLGVHIVRSALRRHAAQPAGAAA